MQIAELIDGVKTGDAPLLAKFDAYVAREGFVEIDSCADMHQFLMAAQARFQVLNELPSKLEGDQMKAWQILSAQFDDPNADLRIFFTEIDEFHALEASRRRELVDFADGLVAKAPRPRFRG